MLEKIVVTKLFYFSVITFPYDDFCVTTFRVQDANSDLSLSVSDNGNDVGNQAELWALRVITDGAFEFSNFYSG